MKVTQISGMKFEIILVAGESFCIYVMPPVRKWSRNRKLFFKWLSVQECGKNKYIKDQKKLLQVFS